MLNHGYFQRNCFTQIHVRYRNTIEKHILIGSWLFLSGDITYNLKLEVESMVWLDDLSNPGSLASQQLSAKFQKAV